LREYASQLLLAATIDYVGSRLATALIHSHIERSLASERETSWQSVEVVRRYTEVGQYAVHTIDSAQTQCRAQKAEVALDIVESFIVGGVGLCVAVLVEAIERTLAAKRLQYTTRVATSTKREVGIATVGFDVE
jgi:hypothetical protein